MSLSWDMSSNDKKLRKLRNYQKWLAWHSLAVYVWYKVNLLENKPFYQKNIQTHIGNELNMTKQRQTESSCVLCKLVQHIPIICHTKLFSQCYNKNLLIFYLFWCFFKLCQTPLSQDLWKRELSTRTPRSIQKVLGTCPQHNTIKFEVRQIPSSEIGKNLHVF